MLEKVNKKFRLFIPLFLSLVVLQPDSVLSQSLFNIKDTFPDYSAYENLDECVGAIYRTVRELRSKDSVFLDTAQYVPEDPARSLPDSVVRIAEICTRKMVVDTLIRQHIHFWASALLMANRDSEVEEMYARYFTSVPFSEGEKVRQFMSMVGVYSEARPMRIDLMNSAYSIAQAHIPVDSVVWTLSLKLLMGAMNEDLGRNSVAKTYYNEVFSVLDTLEPTIKDRQDFKMFVGLGAFTRGMGMVEKERLDSARESNHAIIAHDIAFLRRIFNNVENDFVTVTAIGKKAPALDGDWWFQSERSGVYQKSDSLSLPVKGKLNMIVFLQGGCHLASINLGGGNAFRSNGRRGCLPLLSSVRRISEAYPDVEVTIVSRTFGFFGAAPPLEPYQEADTLAKYFLGFHRILGNLVVSDTDFFRLQGLDQRRIDIETGNELNYHIGGKKLGRHGVVILVDREGEIFYESASHGDVVLGQKDSEYKVRRLIDAVKDRYATQ